MKTKLFTLIALFTISLSSLAQVPTAAIVSVYTQGVKISPEMAESLMRIEVTKTGKFNVLDKLDMLEVLNENQIDVSNCFGKKCLTTVGSQARQKRKLRVKWGIVKWAFKPWTTRYNLDPIQKPQKK